MKGSVQCVSARLALPAYDCCWQQGSAFGAAAARPAAAGAVAGTFAPDAIVAACLPSALVNDLDLSLRPEQQYKGQR
jgi:hypothetical protein